MAIRGAADRQGTMLAGTICALVGASLWGFSGACAQLLYANPAITPEFVTAVRALLTAVALGAFALVRHRSAFLGLLGERRSWPPLAAYAFGLFASQVAYAFSIKATNAGTATVLQSLFMVIVLVLSCLKARRLPRAVDFLGLVCALTGTWLIATGGEIAGLVVPLDGLGWGLANAAAVALYIVAPQRLYDRWGSMPVIAAGMVLNSLMAIALWLVTSASGGFSIPVLGLEEWLVLVLGVALAGTAAAYALYLYGVSVVGSVRGSLLGAVEPVSAMALAFLWLSTPLTGADWLGAALMVAMIVMVSLPGKKKLAAPNECS